jgi:hypothetical protein
MTNACLWGLAPAALLLATRLRWVALAAWLAGLGAAAFAVTIPGLGALKLLLIMPICEAVAASAVGRGGVLRGVLGAVAGKVAFIVFLWRWVGHAWLPSGTFLFLAALAASGAAGAALAVGARKS